MKIGKIYSYKNRLSYKIIYFAKKILLQMIKSFYYVWEIWLPRQWSVKLLGAQQMNLLLEQNVQESINYTRNTIPTQFLSYCKWYCTLQCQNFDSSFHESLSCMTIDGQGNSESISYISSNPLFIFFGFLYVAKPHFQFCKVMGTQWTTLSWW